MEQLGAFSEATEQTLGRVGFKFEQFDFGT